jgi:alpha-L-rhamnosidase
METALASFEKGAFFTKWMEDWRDVQGEDGDIPHTAPTYEGGGGPAWSGVCITLPWEVWLAYGDERILADCYPVMQRWLSFLETHCRDGILHRYGHESWGFLGDWVPPGRQQGVGGRVDDRSTLFFNNCYRHYVVARMAEIAEVLGKVDDAAAYRAQAEEIRRIVHEEFFDPETASYANGEQPYLAFPLLAGLTPPEHVDAVMNRLERVILDEKGGHVDSGIHGTYFLLKWLTEAQRNDLVHEMVSQETYPSWGHMLEEGATTIWEQWDGLNSRCHSSFLSVGAWFIEGIAGIRADPEHPGFEHFTIRPALVGDLEWARASYESIRGPIASAFQRDGSKVTVSVEVPPNTRATVFVPADDPSTVTESDVPAAEATGVRFLRHEDGRAIYEVRSGFYSFASTVTGRADR